eukprot:TRINITY_DN5036_c0_g1_i1.p1 TRINITY_DN5036_c0_g1~~TRINITY_DN5036_c0_g1_i1.p1  ORF type:complete len:290 (-),score=55.95 TRINITY_DN5036_c0_g1_i1:483-1352(-)
MAGAVAVVSPAAAFASLILAPAGRQSSCTTGTRLGQQSLLSLANIRTAVALASPALSRSSSPSPLCKLTANTRPYRSSLKLPVAALVPIRTSRQACRLGSWLEMPPSHGASIGRGFSVNVTAGGATTPEVAQKEKEGAESLAKGEADWEKESPNWTIKMLYDGDCPLCMREVDMLRERNKTYGTIAFVDIASDNYEPKDHANISFEDAMGRIHGIKRDGQVVRNVEAFRAFYEAVGLGWVYAITQIEMVGKAADVVYDIWAKYRLPLTRRPPLADILLERNRKKECRTD